MKSLPKVSVVITNYNYAQYLVEVVESARSQSYSAHEIIVVDDASSDESREILEELVRERKIKAIFREKNGGQWASLRAGVSKSNGDIVALLDADDLWAVDYLKEVAKGFSGDESVDFLFTGRENFGASTGEDAVCPDGRLIHHGPTQILSWLCNHWWAGTTSSCSLRRGLAEQVLEMQLDREWRICADFGIQLAVGLLGARKSHLTKPLMRYRRHESNAWNNSADRSKTDYLEKIGTFQTMGEIKRLGLVRLETALNLSGINKCIAASLLDSLVLEAQLGVKPVRLLKLYLKAAKSIKTSSFSRKRKQISILKKMIKECELKSYKV